jgi:hypothetical protein
VAPEFLERQLAAVHSRQTKVGRARAGLQPIAVDFAARQRAIAKPTEAGVLPVAWSAAQ